ncbi:MULTISPECIES: hypothetical protein [Xenorhabdus]|uniref:Uncharacterized protein n=1 Tax=Xenorhabdus khoisanae TaxID=880157 RepID=A0A0J5FRS4_9GAMM|nr:hypothetical protein [Xenorhabdus khoisanae]KMJ44794.1 hypothetical protein AB204_12455 [Xenorhabdus khoisanae]
MGPIDGTYASHDENFSLTIINSDDRPGTFNGIFKAKDLSIGDLTYNNVTGEYRYVIQQPVFQIGFYAIIRPESTEYVITDHWNGVRTNDKSLLLSGLRTYITSAGSYDIHYFEKILFKMT